MRICVVGGTGNISTSFVTRLLALGHEVTCFNRGQSGPPPEGAAVITGDRADRPAFERTIQAQRFDAAIDMFCFDREAAESSIRAFRGVGHFIQCSTVCTYGVQYDWLPATEDHPLRPIVAYGRNKVEADRAFMRAYYEEGFPITIIKPSTTYGPKIAPRQLAWEDLSWIDRIRKGKPVVVCGDGKALHQFLHVDDAALCFAHIVGRTHTIGQTYNMMRRGFTTWEDYHRTAMQVLGREVELVGIPLADLVAMNPPGVESCRAVFAHNVIYSAEKLFRDVPEFQPAVSLADGLTRVIEAMDREGRIPNSDDITWEDRMIAAQRSVRRNALS